MKRALYLSLIHILLTYPCSRLNSCPPSLIIYTTGRVAADIFSLLERTSSVALVSKMCIRDSSIAPTAKACRHVMLILAKLAKMHLFYKGHSVLRCDLFKKLPCCLLYTSLKPKVSLSTSAVSTSMEADDESPEPLGIFPR